MTLRLTLVASMLLASLNVHAQQGGAGSGSSAASSPWSGKATLGYLATSGNTDNSSLNTAAEVTYARDSWTHVARASAINSTESNETTAEAYQAGWKSQYDFSEKDYVFGRLNWRKDRFSAFDTQISETVGYGRRLIESEEHLLNVELGVGARQAETRAGIEEDDFIVRGGLDYKWQFSETAEFTQDLVIESGQENTYTESISAIKARLIGDLALVASYTIKNNSDVEPGTERTDTYTALSLEYAW